MSSPTRLWGCYRSFLALFSHVTCCHNHQSLLAANLVNHLFKYGNPIRERKTSWDWQNNSTKHAHGYNRANLHWKEHVGVPRFLSGNTNLTILLITLLTTQETTDCSSQVQTSISPGQVWQNKSNHKSTPSLNYRHLTLSSWKKLHWVHRPVFTIPGIYFSSSMLWFQSLFQGVACPVFSIPCFYCPVQSWQWHEYIFPIQFWEKEASTP